MATEAATIDRGVRETGNRQPDSFGAWFGQWQLAVLAGLAWLFTVLGLTLEHVVDVPKSVEVGVYVLAYLAGGTLATRTAIEDLIKGHVNVDLLMVLAAIGAAITDNWAEGAILLSLFSTSNALEEYSLDRTKNAVRALMDLAPDTARVQRGARLVEIPVEELTLEDTIVIQPHERIPADAVSSPAAPPSTSRRSPASRSRSKRPSTTKSSPAPSTAAAPCTPE